ncbi:leucine-rich repeat protein [Mycoplasmatota bacterium zrk1]
MIFLSKNRTGRIYVNYRSDFGIRERVVINLKDGYPSTREDLVNLCSLHIKNTGFDRDVYNELLTILDHLHETNYFHSHKDWIYIEDGIGYLNELKETTICYFGLTNEVRIPTGVKYIGYRSFEDCKLTGITLPESVAVICRRAFHNNNIVEIEIPRGVEKIELFAFGENPITSKKIHGDSKRFDKDWKHICYTKKCTSEEYVFHTFNKDGEANEKYIVEIQDGLSKNYNDVVTITKLHLENLVSEKDIVKLQELTKGIIREEYFVNNKDLFFEHNKILYLDDTRTHLLKSLKKRSKTVRIPKSVKLIMDSAFQRENYQYDGLESVIFPQDLMVIGGWAFYGNALSIVEIPSSVIRIGESAFESNNLTELICPSSLKIMGESAFASNKIKNVNFPENLEYIPKSLLIGNNLKKVTIPGTVKKIGRAAFYGNKISTLELPKSLRYIGKSAFRENRLYTLLVPNSVEEIGSYAFYENKLTSLELSDQIRVLGKGAFEGNKLTSLKIPNSTEIIGEDCFTGNEIRQIEVHGDRDRFNDMWTKIGFPSDLLIN